MSVRSLVAVVATAIALMVVLLAAPPRPTRLCHKEFKARSR